MMITREEKNKEFVNEIKKEKAIKISKKIMHVLGIIFIILIAFVSYIYFVGIKGLKVNEYIIRNNEIPNSFHGVKILHFSDILYGSTISRDELDNLLEQIKVINPNIVVFTGNIISNNYKVSEDEINYLKTFFKSIPYSIGKYAVKGSNDAFSFNLIMENTGFNILDNEINKVYYRTKDFINIIGLNDSNMQVITKENDNYTITLINNYDKYYNYQVSTDLVLAGHNLGGEIRFLNKPLLGKNKYNNSYYEENNSQIYISNGLGTIHHMRFMNHPSINVYRLYAK